MTVDLQKIYAATEANFHTSRAINNTNLISLHMLEQYKFIQMVAYFRDLIPTIAIGTQGP